MDIKDVLKRDTQQIAKENNKIFNDYLKENKGIIKSENILW